MKVISSVFLLLVSLNCIGQVNTNGDERQGNQQVDYVIDVSVDVDKKSLSASAKVSYHNHSQQSLEYLVFELPQQRFRDQTNKASQLTSGTQSLNAQNAAGQTLQVEAKHSYFFVQLLQAIQPGQTELIILNWDLQLIERDGELSPRSGYETSHTGGSLLAAAQWYPRALGFDQRFQWDTLPFKGKGEFHLELGEFEVNITAPQSHIVTATGKLTNAQQVLSAAQLKQFLASRSETVFISKVASTPNKLNTWRFTSELSRDFAFALGDNLVWERKSIHLSTGVHHVNVFYPDNGRWFWQKYAMNAAVHALSYLDANLAPFPFKDYTLFNIAGISMEHPGLAFVGFRGPDHIGEGEPNFSRTQKHDVLGGTFHEIAHSYFPMYVNTNERREGFFDEGITSYLAYLLEQSWSEDFQSFYGSPLDVVPVMSTAYQTPFTLADNLKNKLDSHYHIPATAWHILAEQIIGTEALLQLLNKFVITWQHKRAYFSDLVIFLDANTGQNLAPFFNFWFESGKHVDLAISAVTQAKNQALISISNLGGIPMPVLVKIVFQSGEIASHYISYQDWKAPYQQLQFDVTHPSPIIRVVLDPNNISADTNTSNNQWPLIGG